MRPKNEHFQINDFPPRFETETCGNSEMANWPIADPARPQKLSRKQLLDAFRLHIPSRF